MTESRTHTLGDVLRGAREAKGVDLSRVERETKIRERYLSALERGEYRELPGSVYTKGFLRNYGAYLGLDPEYLIDLYRLETSATPDRARVPASPRPLATRRSRAFVVTPNAVVGAILTVMVGAFIAYLAFEIINFARTPELRITDPAGNVSRHTEPTITIRGATAENARVVVENLRENPTVLADENGDFEVRVSLVPGSNVVRLTATDPVTGRTSATEERTITVVTDVAEPSPTPDDVALAVEEPEVDASFSGAVPVSGTAAPGTTVTISAELVEAATPSFSVEDATGASVAVDPATPGPPDPLTLEADPSGTFSDTMSLRVGTWDVTIEAEAVDPVSRRVTVRPGEGLTARIRISGGDSYLEVDEDGTPVEDVSGGISADGDRIDIRADQDLRIRAGNAGAVRLTINGINIGAMGNSGAVVEWRITRSSD